MFGWLNRKGPTQQKPNRLSDAVPSILSAYGDLLAKYPTAIMDASWLPVKKQIMVEVFKVAWLNSKSDEARNWIEVGWTLLPNFQEGVGDVPLTPDLPEGLPTKETMANLDKYVMWAKLADAEGAIMQHDRDEFKKAKSPSYV
jgi:hypothetical protein